VIDRRAYIKTGLWTRLPFSSPNQQLPTTNNKMATTESQPQGTSATSPPAIKEPTTNDPFASQRDTINPFSSTSNGANETKLSSSPPKKDDRRLSSDEWDASKTPPSRFQQRKGSVYATPSSRDGHVDKNYDRDAAYHAKLAEKGWAKRRASKGEETTK